MALADSSEQFSWSMFVAAHRAQAPQRLVRNRADRVLVFAPDPDVQRWIEHETFGERVTVELVSAPADILTCLTLVPPPWPQFLVLDVDAISPADVDLLGAIRAAGWLGTAIAIGDASHALRRALGIDVVLPRTLACELLRNALKQAGTERPTVRIRRAAR